MGKGSNRREFNRELDRAYREGFPFKHKKVDGRVTKMVVHDGKLVPKEELSLYVGIDFAEVRTDYSTAMGIDQLRDCMTARMLGVEQ